MNDAILDFVIDYGIPGLITGCVCFVAGLITWANCFDRIKLD